MGKGSNHFLVPFALFLFGSLTKEPIPWNNAFWPGLTPFWPTAVVGEADSVNSVSASACHIGGPKGVSPGQKALLRGNSEVFELS